MPIRDLRDYRFVLLVDGHFNPLGLCRSLGECGVRPDVVTTGGQNALVAKSKYVGSLRFVDTPQEGVDAVLNDYSSDDKKAFLMTGGDKIMAAIDERYDDLKPYFYLFNCGRQGEIVRLMSKREQNILAQSVGLNVPAFEEVNVGEMPQVVKFPLMTKAVDSTVNNWKAQTFICRNESELREAYSHIDTPRILLQEYIDKENETGFNGVALGYSSVYTPLQLSYFSTEATTFGGSIYLFRPTDNELVDKVHRLMALTGYSGVFSTDFVVGKDGKVYFLEINFRHSGWSYPYTRAGVNLPVIWAKSVLSGKLETADVRIRRLPFSCVIDLDEISRMMKVSVKKGLAMILHTLRSDSFIYWRLNDQGPFWYKVKSYLGNHLRLRR